MPVSIAGSGTLSGFPGIILQVVQNVYSVETAIASTTYTNTGLSATITPKFSNSKILVCVSQHIYTQIQANTDQGAGFRILRNGNEVFQHPRAVVFRAGTGASSFTLAEGVYSFMYLDSPSSLTPLTYSTQIKAMTVATAGQVVAQLTNAPSTITLFEVAS